MENDFLLPAENTMKSTEQSFVIFLLKNKKYAINISNVIEIINIPEIEIPENTPRGIIGMFNYNGIMIKAVDLCPFLGFEPSMFSLDNKIIIVKENEEYFAIHTENIEAIIRPEKENIQNMPFNTEESVLSSVYKTEEGSYNIINCNSLYKLISGKNTNKSLISYANLFPKDEKSQKILKIRAKKYIKPAENFDVNLQNFKQYVLFVLNNRNYCLDITNIKEFVSMRRLNVTKLPYTPDYTEGIVSVKGEFLLVINLKKFMNLEDKTETSKGKLIVIEGKNFNIALLVDDIKYIKILNATDMAGMYSSSNNYIYKEFMENDKLYSILNYEKIINDERLYINVD